jgi:hypothetical protein
MKAKYIILIAAVMVIAGCVMAEKNTGDNATPPPPSALDQVPMPTVAKGSGEQPTERTISASKTRSLRNNQVIWMSDDEVKTIDLVAIRQRLRSYHKPPGNLIINNRDQAREYFCSVGSFVLGGWPDRCYEDSDYYYFFWADEETGLVKTISGGAVSKKTLEIMKWYF